jgi:diacylglycerol O-acyltransferase / wax synthase
MVDERGEMKRLNGWDAMLVYSETPNVHNHTLKVAVIDAADFDGDFSFELFRRTLLRRLHLLEPLRYKLVDIPLKLHHPMWLEKCELDLDYHVRRIRVPGPGGRRELDQVIGEVASTPLDRTRPLWEMHFTEGMADHRFAVIGKVHHALADGVASANLMARALDLKLGAPDERESYDSCSLPSRTELVRAAARDHVQHIKELPAMVKDSVSGVGRVRRRAQERGHHPDLARMFDPPATFINHLVSPGRTFASATLSLAEVKQTSKKLGITINDLVLATTAGALRELLLRYGGRADEPLIASVPVSIDKSPGRISGNALSGMMVSLPVHVDDPLTRVRLTKTGVDVGRENFELLGPTTMARWMDYMPPPLAPPAFRWLAYRDAKNKLYNVPVSNVPGPRERGRIAGAPMSEIYSVGPLTAGSAVNITVWSYVDQLNISVLADDQTFTDVHQATDAMVHAFAEIRDAQGLGAELTTVPTAMAPATAAG